MTSQIKRDASGRRTIEMEFEVPGTPEQVWQAIATGPGITSWMCPADVDGRTGGAVAFHLGPETDSSGTVTAWEPPVRFAYEEPDWSPPAPPLATEFIIEARSGGTCVVRLVHSLFASSDDWDDQMKDFETGWSSLFNVLRLYLTHFFGQPCSHVRVTGPSETSEADTWDALARVLGLAGAGKGERRTFYVDAGPPLTGVIERITAGVQPYEALLRLDRPVPGLALIGAYSWGGRTHGAITLYLYGERAAASAAHFQSAMKTFVSPSVLAPRLDAKTR